LSHVWLCAVHMPPSPAGGGVGGAGCQFRPQERQLTTSRGPWLIKSDFAS